MIFSNKGRQKAVTVRQILGLGAKTPTAGLVGKLTSKYALGLVGMILHATPLGADVRVGFVTDVGFSYLDRLKNPVSPAQIATVNLIEPTSSASDRTLGLTRMGLGLRITSENKTWMSFSLRPDAEVRNDPEQPTATEWDSRAGLTRVSARQINLLDEYSVGAKLGTAKFEIGSFANLDTWVRRDILDFGLRVIGPQNFFAARCDWMFGQSPTVAGSTGGSAESEVQISIFQGPEDRNEKFLYEERSGDVAPATKNPYPGFTVGYHFHPADSSTHWSLLASHFTRIETTEKYSDYFLRFGIDGGVTWMDRKIGYGLVLRTNIERDFGGGMQAKDLLQSDVSIRSSFELSANRTFEAQVDYGRAQVPLSSDPAQVVTSSGFQYQIGMKAEVLRSVYASAFLGREQRSNELSGTKTGGFGSAERKYESSDRFLVSVNYIAAGVL